MLQNNTKPLKKNQKEKVLQYFIKSLEKYHQPNYQKKIATTTLSRRQSLHNVALYFWCPRARSIKIEKHFIFPFHLGCSITFDIMYSLNIFNMSAEIINFLSQIILQFRFGASSKRANNNFQSIIHNSYLISATLGDRRGGSDS